MRYIIIVVAIVFTGTFILLGGLVGAHLVTSRHERVNEHVRALTERARMQPPDARALESLIGLLHSTDSFERTAAAIGLGRVGANAEPGVDALIEHMRGPDPFVAREAARSIGEIGPNAKHAVPALAEAVQQRSDADVGWFAAESLGHVADPSDSVATDVLQQATHNSDERMRYSAARGLRILESRRDKTR